MDSLTHIALGACIGDAVLSKKIGRKGMLVGAIAQSFPDFDIIGTLWLSLPENLWFHRGITHSLLFGFLAAFLLAYVTQKIFKSKNLSYKNLVIFFCLQMWLHNILDTCNSYGTGLLEPFSDHRFSFDVLFVADPLFSIPLIIAATALLILKTNHPARMKWIIPGLILPCLYLIYAFSNKNSIHDHISKSLESQQIPVTNFVTTPTVFNTWLWYIMAPVDSGVYIGYRSIYDDENYVTPFEFFPKNEHLLSTIDSTEDIVFLKKLADGNYTFEQAHDSLIFNVPRFGRIAGWDSISTGFNFQFYLNEGYDNNLLIQKGRAKEINSKTFTKMINRIKGYGKEN
ncbi:MAG: metal-dependent hydrolase [Ginsengibacter sp.]